MSVSHIGVSHRTTRSQHAEARVRSLLGIDAAFELALALLLLVIGLTGRSGELGLPTPAGDPLVVVFGLFLLPVGAGLWMAARAKEAPPRFFVLGLAAANGLGVVVFVAWLLLAAGSFGAAGALLTGGVAAVLALLAVLEWRADWGATAQRT
jgi:hypothetical protein